MPYERFVDKEKRKDKKGAVAPTSRRRVPRRELLEWYTIHGRHDLPWRKTHDPYAVLVSEFMLQQTTVAAVKHRFYSWMRRFPTLSSLASASEESVLNEWQGLGYYSRARRLHDAAQVIMDRHGGMIPSNLEALLELPGIGEYTAAAILAFSYDLPAVVLDTNISRVVARWNNLRLPIESRKGKSALKQLAGNFFGHRESRTFTSALMDLGAMICVSGVPHCKECPMKTTCQVESPETLPKKFPKVVTTKRTEHRAWIFHDDKLFLELSKGPLWRGLWILPEVGVVPSSRCIAQLTYPITHYRVLMKVHPVTGIPGALLRGFTPSEINSIAIPSPHRRAIAAAGITSHSED